MKKPINQLSAVCQWGRALKKWNQASLHVRGGRRLQLKPRRLKYWCGQAKRYLDLANSLFGQLDTEGKLHLRRHLYEAQRLEVIRRENRKTQDRRFEAELTVRKQQLLQSLR